MTPWKRARTVIALALAALGGYVAGPPLVHAVEGLVVVKSGAASKPGQARVTSNRLWVDPGVPPSSADVRKIFTILDHQNFLFVNNPEFGLVSETESTEYQPCEDVLPTANRFVITGIDLSSGQSTPGGVGQVHTLDVQGTLGADVFFQFQPTGFHDATGVFVPADEALDVIITMKGAGNQVCSETGGCAVEPALFHVYYVIQGYCADET